MLVTVSCLLIALLLLAITDCMRALTTKEKLIRYIFKK